MVTLPLTPLARAARSPFVTAAMIAVLAMLVRLPYLSWPITTDEGGYALGAYWWSRGVTLYSQDLWFDRPQGIFVAYRVGIALLGESVPAIRLWGAMWFAASAIGVWALARTMCNERTALLAGLLTALACASPRVEGFTANAEGFMLAGTTASAVLAWRGRFGWAGFAGGLAVMLKPSGVSALALCLLWLVYTRPPRGAWIACFAAAAAPLAAGLLHGWATVGVGTFMDAAILFRAMHPVSDQGLRFVRGFTGTLLVTLAPVALALVGFRALPPRARAFWLMWLATSIGGVAMGGNWWPHYFVQVLPPLCLAAAACVDHALDSRLRVPQVAASLAVVLLAFPWAWYAWQGPIRGVDALYGRAGFLVERQIGDFIRERTDPDERIYIAFSEPGLNYHAQRMSTVPWLYIHQLTDVEGALERTLQAVAAGVPRYVVIVDDGPAYAAGFPALLEAMGDKYELEGQYPGAAVYRRR